MDVGYIKPMATFGIEQRHILTKVAITDDGGENENSNQVAGDGEDVPERKKNKQEISGKARSLWQRRLT